MNYEQKTVPSLLLPLLSFIFSLVNIAFCVIGGLVAYEGHEFGITLIYFAIALCLFSLAVGIAGLIKGSRGRRTVCIIFSSLGLSFSIIELCVYIPFLSAAVRFCAYIQQFR